MEGDGSSTALFLKINMADNSGNSTTKALVEYLRMEADLADEKARRLRSQAAELSEQYGVTAEMQSQYELHPDQLPPLNDRGVPKYKGKKRGRKPKPRKRKLDPNRLKRQHTAYTLFVKEIYPTVKAQNPALQSKEVISIVAKQWKENLTADEKREWKTRAKSTHRDADEDDADDDDDDDAETDNDETDDYVAHLQVGGDAEATAVADAVYQQTVADMEAQEEHDDEQEEDEEEHTHDDDNENDVEKNEEHVNGFHHDTVSEEVEESPPQAKRRRGRLKKS